MTPLRQDERGAVALLTTIIISILLAIITTGLITLMISELRQEVDTAQANKAYYAAQSGVEDGVSKVVAALNSGQVDQLCPPTPSASIVTATKNLNLEPGSPGQVGWTCQQITYSGSPEGSLSQPDKAVQIDIGAPTFNSIIVEWDQAVAAPAAYFNAPLGNFPTQAGWNYAAALELAMIKYPTGSFSASNAGNITLTNALIVPRTSGSNVANVNTLKGSNPIVGRCNALAVGYHCKAIIDRFNGGGASNYTLRLRSRYVGTDYKLTFTTGNGGNGAVVRVPDGTATIDVTAKAGTAFRRVVYKVPYKNTAATGLDFVIYSDTDICKNFGIINGSVNPLSIGCPY